MLGNSNSLIGLVEIEVAIGELVQLEKEPWIKITAPVNPATTIANQRNWETFDCEEPIRDKPWIVDVAKKSLTTSIVLPSDSHV